MNFLRSVLLLAALVAPATALAQRSGIGWDMADALAAEVASCPSAQLPPEARRRERSMHNPDPESYVHRQLERMLRADPASCRGIAAAAVARLRVLVGEPERADVPSGFVALARIAAEEGLGMARDPVLADRYGRIEWLFDSEAREIPRWTGAQQQAWLTRPETIALLEAYVAEHRYVQRQPRLLAELRLRRDVPGYDPERALALFEHAGDHDRYAEVLSDGVHMPPDYRRAFEPMFRLGMFDLFEPQERLIIRIGRRAAAAARTPEERGEALRILFAGSVNDLDGSCALLAAQRRHFDGAPVVPIAEGEARRIHENLSDDYDAFMISDDPPRPGPIILRALIDPGGRVIYARVRQSSGSRDRDHIALRAWARSAEEVDLSATARGRFVWADLPPIPAESTTTMPARAPRSSCL